MHYTMTIAGVERDLPLFPVSLNTSIAAFIMFGDVEVTVAAARDLLAKAPEFDIIFTAEAKSIPLAYEMTRQAGLNDYVVARKRRKVYMGETLSSNVNSITTAGTQELLLGEADAAKLKGKRVLIVDDVISTGESLKAIQSLAEAAGANVVASMAVLAEGIAADRDDIIFLDKLPLFNADGTVKAD